MSIDDVFRTDSELWIGFSNNGVWDYRCGNPMCLHIAPVGFEDFNLCPYCGSKKIKYSNSLNSLNDDVYNRILFETEMDLGRSCG